jgi:hypothetical protein
MMNKMMFAGCLGFGLLLAEAFASPCAALFVRNGAGAPLDARLGEFADAVSGHLAREGFAVVRDGEPLDFGDGGSDAAKALDAARPLDADCIVGVSILSLGETIVRSQDSGLPRSSRTRVLRLFLHVFDARDGTRIYGDTVIVADPIGGATEPADPLGGMLDRGAAEMAARVRTAAEASGKVRVVEDASQALRGSSDVTP